MKLGWVRGKRQLEVAVRVYIEPKGKVFAWDVIDGISIQSVASGTASTEAGAIELAVDIATRKLKETKP